MAIKTFYASQEDAPEPLREHLVAAESGDGYVLEIETEDFRAHPLAAGLKSALDKERQRANTAEKRLKEASDNLDETARAELDEWRRKGPELEERATTAEKRIGDLTVDSVVARAVAEHKGDPKTLPRAIRPDIGFDDEGVFVRGPDGEPRISKEGDRMTVGDLVKEMSSDPDYSAFFLSPVKSGAGTPPGDRTPRGGDPAPWVRPGAGSRPLTAVEQRNAERRAKIDRYREAQQ